MSKIVKVIRCLNRSDHAIIEVELDHGGAAEVFIGGEVEEYFHHGKTKAFVMKGRPPRKGIDSGKLNE